MRSISSLRASSLSGALAIDGRLPVEKLEENHSQTEDVGTPHRPDVPRHEPALDSYKRGSLRSLHAAEVLVPKCKTKVGNKSLPRGIDQDVPRLSTSRVFL